MSDKYGLHWHPTTRGIPIAIEDIIEKRIVAILKDEAKATMEEARAMVSALNKLKSYDAKAEN